MTRHALLTLRSSPSLSIGLAIIVTLIVASVLGPLLSPFGVTEQRNDQQLLSPGTAGHLWGTDINGMDVFVRTLAAARYDLAVATAAASTGMVLGVLVGAVAGYVGRLGDEALSRGVEALQAFPPVLLALALVAALGTSTIVLIAVIALVQAPYYVRTMRAQVLSIRAREFVEAARAIGLPEWRVLLRHVVPNAVRPIVVQFSLNIGTAILLISLLGFIGVGAQVPAAEWGLMVSSGVQVALTGQWWAWALPGAMILLSVVAFNLMGDGVRDILDPRRSS